MCSYFVFTSCLDKNASRCYVKAAYIVLTQSIKAERTLER